ncbi:MAG TPA: hypothetical protein VKT99_13055 [Xanthobacteraceae bacterium]|nr:hypothetical protein [Xanthobacteraceae bacterium]
MKLIAVSPSHLSFLSLSVFASIGQDSLIANAENAPAGALACSVQENC